MEAILRLLDENQRRGLEVRECREREPVQHPFAELTWTDAPSVLQLDAECLGGLRLIGELDRARRWKQLRKPTADLQECREPPRQQRIVHRGKTMASRGVLNRLSLCDQVGGFSHRIRI